MPVATPGQHRALSDLARISRVTDDRIRLVSVLDEKDGPGIHVELVISCAGTAESSVVNLEPVETVWLYVPPEYPFAQPGVYVEHERFARLPHVMWGCAICLYPSANEWIPSDGMWGLVSRLVTFLRRAAAGTLAGPALPWHPPFVPADPYTADLVLRADLPEKFEANPDLWCGWAAITPLDRVVELNEWLARPEDGPDGVAIAAVIALPQPLGFQYPHQMNDLLDGLARGGLSHEAAHLVLERLDRANAEREERVEGSIGEVPRILLIGSPAPQQSRVSGRIAHFAAWQRVPADGTAHVGHPSEPITWMRVFDQRPRSTIRRDVSRPTHWLEGRRILLLGCGALGAPIAEYCVRAGVALLQIADHGIVSPGVLVRQPYSHADIGWPKAVALGSRLNAIAPGTAIEPFVGDVATLFYDGAAAPAVDLLIDATADRLVMTRLERCRWLATSQWPPVLTVATGHRSERGVATVSLPGATGAGLDTFRRLALTAITDDGLADVLDDFYPAQARHDLFQPEPGCSEPTFVGSAADVSALAAGLLTGALTALAAAERERTSPGRLAIVCRPYGDRPSGVRYMWANDLTVVDESSGYQVRLDNLALAAMRRSAVKVAETAGSDVETGGVLLGHIDRAAGVIWVSEAYGPAGGSSASSSRLVLNVDAARPLMVEQAQRSRGLVRFVGLWHTHPAGPVQPSAEDIRTMTAVVNDGGSASAAALLVIVGGPPDRWLAWLAGNGAPALHTAVIFPD